VCDYLNETISELECRFDRVRQTPAILRAHDQTVDDDRDRVVLATIQLRWICELDCRTIDDDANESLLPYGFEQIAEFSLATAHERGKHFDACPLRPGQDALGNLPGALSLDRAPTLRAMGRAGARVQQAQVVVDLRDRADGRPRIVPSRLLLDGNRRREPLNGVDIGLLHKAQELSRVCGKRFDVAALPFGVNGVEGERGLAGAGQARDDRQPITRDRDVDVLEVVLAGAPDDECFFCHSR
jgi:hypothetical protein